MEKINSRRNFIKTGISAGLLISPIASFAQGLNWLYEDSLSESGEFSLRKLEKILPGYQLPNTNEFSTNNYKSTYSIYSLYVLGSKKHLTAGELQLERSLKGSQIDTQFKIRRNASAGQKNRSKPFSFFMEGHVFSPKEKYGFPSEWICNSKIARSEIEKPYLNSDLKKHGKAENQKVSFTINEQLKKNNFEGDLIWKWGIIDLVQKMAEESIDSKTFTSVDEFENMFQTQSIQFKKYRQLDTGESGVIQFKAYEHIGQGIIPTVYWIDDKNRVVFIISGMEGYVLNSSTSIH